MYIYIPTCMFMCIGIRGICGTANGFYLQQYLNKSYRLFLLFFLSYFFILCFSVCHALILLKFYFFLFFLFIIFYLFICSATEPTHTMFCMCVCMYLYKYVLCALALQQLVVLVLHLLTNFHSTLNNIVHGNVNMYIRLYVCTLLNQRSSAPANHNSNVDHHKSYHKSKCKQINKATYIYFVHVHTYVRTYIFIRICLD